MKGKKASSKDVAKLANVSQSAVSRAFTSGSSIKPMTKEKIIKAAQELGYRPNIMARSMKTQKSKIIGFVFGYMKNQYYPLALEQLSRKLQELGYHSLMFFADSNEPADRIVEEFLQYQIDGVILGSVPLSDDWLEACHHVNVPVVLFNRAIDDRDVSAITSDNRKGGALVAEFLVKQGRKKLAFIAGYEGSSTSRDREQGFVVRLAELGMPLYWRGVGNYTQTEASEVTRNMFSGPEEEWPDAVFVANDHMAFAVLDVLRHELNIDVPGKVGVVGYDDVPIAKSLAYNLTTVQQSIDLMVEKTVEVLMEKIDDPMSPARRIEIEGPLIERKSTNAEA
jgi:DNA-binding LacI/PurR family transcriptional regulator